jgi:RimJ/RimL family protein N-acetyltransferase
MTPWNPQPTLAGALVHLRPLVREDLEDLFRVASDPMIWEQHPAKDRSERAGFVRFFDDALASGGALLATDAETGQVIGSSRFSGYDADLSEVEIGWTFLARSHWGGRYNTEMKRLMLDYAFQSVRSVIFIVGTGNIRSQRAVEKLGANREDMTNRFGRESYIYRLRRP